MTDETKREIAALYADKSNKAHDICAVYHISPTSLAKIVLEQGGELRRPKTARKVVKRPRCKQKIEVKGARFCPFCGADVRSDKDKLIERLKELHGLIPLLPAGERDKMRDTVNATICFLMKGGERHEK